MVDHGEEFRFGQNRNPQRLRLGQLGTGSCTGHNISSLFRDRAAGLAAVLDDESFCLIPGERFQCAGDDQRLSGQLIAFRLALPLHIQPRIGQPMHEIRCAVLCKEFHDALRHYTAKAVDLADLLHRSFPDGLQGAEMFCQQCRRLVADIPDAKPEEQLVQIVLLGAFDGIQQIGRAFLFEFVQRQQFFHRQIVEIRCRMHPFFFHQLGRHGCSEAVDIHGIPGGKMDDIAERLRRALRIHAPKRSLVFQMDDRCPTGGADLRHLIGLRILGVLRHPDHFRDDIPRLAHLNGIADAKSELLDEIFVVERSPGDGGAGQKDRVKAGRRRQNTGAANGHLDAAEHRFLDFGRVFEGNGPARKFIGGTHAIPLRKMVDLDDRTIHIEIELGAILADLVDLRNGILDVVDDVVPGRDGQTEALEIIQTFGVGRQRVATDLLDIEDEDGKTAAPGDLGILLAQRARRCVAGVFERCRPLQFLLGTEMLERFVGHINFAAHLEKFRRIFQFFGNGTDGADIGRHILAHNAVAAGRGTNQLTVFVLQAAGKTINFDLHDILWLDVGFAHPAVKIPQFVV